MKLIVANWKNNPASFEEAAVLAEATDNQGLVISPPRRFLEKVGRIIKKSKLGAQDLFWDGDKPPAGVEYVIIGHSDRRKLGETNEIVAGKLARVTAGLAPILCVGETLKQKQTGRREEIIKEEIISAFSGLAVSQPVYIAYEPIWAISTSINAEPDRPENTLEVIGFIKNILSSEALSWVHFLYGGSVNSGNADDFLKHEEIAGALVGAASLEPKEINEIIKIAGRY